ncbi:MAG: hypothetical protein ACK4TA_20885, partial [Saprospiraceae bacterium]
MKRTFTFFNFWNNTIALVALLTVMSVPSLLQAQRFVHSSGNCGGNNPCYTSLQAAIDAASPNETITLLSSITEGRVTVNKSLIINGGNFVLTSTSNTFGLVINATNVTVQNLTVQEAGTFGIITFPDADGLTLTNVRAVRNGRLVPINGASGSGIALTGINGATLTNITTVDNKGNGISITASQNVMITTFTSSGNAFTTGFSASIGLFSSTNYNPCSVTGVAIQGVITAAEAVLVYQEDNETDGCAFPNISATVSAPSAYFVGVCNSSDGAWTRTLADANSHATGLDFTNTAYSARQMYVQDFTTVPNKYYVDGTSSGFDANLNAASTTSPCPLTTPTAVAYNCNPNNLPEIEFNLNGQTVNDGDEININICNTFNNITCAPNPLHVTNLNSLGLPTGAEIGYILDFAGSNLTVNGLPLVDVQTCASDSLEMLGFEPTDLMLIDCESSGRLTLTIQPFVDLNGNCAFDPNTNECLGAVTTVNITVQPFASKIIAEDETWTLPECDDDVQVCYSFNIESLGDCSPEEFLADVNLLNLFDFGGLEDNLVSNLPRIEPTGNNLLFIEYCFKLKPEDAGTYNINLKYECLSVSPKIQIIANQNVTDYRNLACIGTVNVTLDENCTHTLTASEVLQGSVVCDQDFCVEVVQAVDNRIVYRSSEGILNGCGEYVYRVYRKNSDGSCGNIICWGNVNAEDKTAPDMECPEDARYGAQVLPVFHIEDELSEDDAFFDP